MERHSKQPLSFLKFIAVTLSAHFKLQMIVCGSEWNFARLAHIFRNVFEFVWYRILNLRSKLIFASFDLVWPGQMACILLPEFKNRIVEPSKWQKAVLYVIVFIYCCRLRVVDACYLQLFAFVVEMGVIELGIWCNKLITSWILMNRWKEINSRIHDILN